MSEFLQDLGKGAAGTIVNGALNTGLGLLGQSIVNKQARENYKWQYENFLSPNAQVKGMTAAGLNPAAAFGNNAPVLNSGGLSVPANPLGGIGTSSLSDIANYINAKAQAKKAGAEVKNLDIDAQVKQFEFDLSKVFSAPEKFAALTLAWKNVRLADDEHSIKEWEREKEKALSQTQGIQRDTLQKVLDNMDTQLKQENKQREENIKLTQEKQKTEGTQQQANKASANASNAAAQYNREMARLQRALADIEESGKYFKLESLIKHYRASGMLDDKQYEEAYKLYKNLHAINADNDAHSWNQAADDLLYYLGEQIRNLSPFSGMFKFDYSSK